MSRKRKKLKHPKVTVSAEQVNETGRKVLTSLFNAGRPMTDRQLTERINYVWGEHKSPDAVWRSRKALVELELVADRGRVLDRAIAWSITEMGREFVRRHCA